MVEVLKNIDWKTINEYVDKDLLITNKHPELDLWILNYSKTCQFEKAWDLVTLSCRGLVVDKEGNIVARPFTKFFNKEELETEGYMDTTNIGTIPTDLEFETFEKMDGSLGLMFKYKRNWVFASRGSFESDQAIKGREYISTWFGGGNHTKHLKKLDKEFTFIFEIIYPENRIVVNYGDSEDLVLLGVINTKTGDELPYNVMFEKYRTEFSVVNKYYMGNDVSKLKENDDELNSFGSIKEGFVVRFTNGFRMKVKFDEYCRLHRIVTNVSNKTIWESLKNDEGLADVLERVPDEFYNWVKKTEKELRDSYREIEHDAMREFIRISYLVELSDALEVSDRKKHFALEAIKYKESGLLFSMYNGKDYSAKIWKMIKPEWSTPFRDGYEEDEEL